MAESFEAQRMWRPEIQRLYRKYKAFFPPHTLKDFIRLLDDADEVISSRSRAVCEAFDDELARFLKIYRGYVGSVERLASDIKELTRKTLGRGSEAMEAEQVSKKSAWRPVIREIYEEYRGHSRRQAYYGSSSAS